MDNYYLLCWFDPDLFYIWSIKNHSDSNKILHECINACSIQYIKLYNHRELSDFINFRFGIDTDDLRPYIFTPELTNKRLKYIPSMDMDYIVKNCPKYLAEFQKLANN